MHLSKRIQRILHWLSKQQWIGFYNAIWRYLRRYPLNWRILLNRFFQLSQNIVLVSRKLKNLLGCKNIRIQGFRLIKVYGIIGLVLINRVINDIAIIYINLFILLSLERWRINCKCRGSLYLGNVSILRTIWWYDWYGLHDDIFSTPYKIMFGTSFYYIFHRPCLILQWFYTHWFFLP
jgi:hypothetical protein